MAARPTCSCAFIFAGFPIPVRIYTILASRKSASFKMLDPVHKAPVSQKLVDIEGEFVERAETLKGVAAGDGRFVALGDDALELIENVGRSESCEIERFAPVESVALDLALERYKIVPNDKVPGSENPVKILWNGLRESHLVAIIPDWCPRAGARPSTLAVRATGDELAGSLLPFGSEFKLDLPVWVPEADEKAAQMFAAVVEQQYSTADFDISAYTDGYAERRDAAIKLALSGEPITLTKPAAPAAATPDMMAMLEATLAAGPAKKAAKKSAAKAAVAA